MVSGKLFHTIRLEYFFLSVIAHLTACTQQHRVDKELKRKGEGEILLFTFQGGTDQSQPGSSSSSVIITGDICGRIYGFFDGTSHAETRRLPS